MTLVTGAANAENLITYCDVLVVAGKRTFSDTSSYAKPTRLGHRYKPSEFVMGIQIILYKYSVPERARTSGLHVTVHLCEDLAKDELTIGRRNKPT